MDIEEECGALIYFIEFFFNLIWMAFVLLCKTLFHHKFVKVIPFTKINRKKRKSEIFSSTKNRVFGGFHLSPY